MPLRIKLPPKANEPDGLSEPVPGRRKTRLLTVTSDEENDYADSGHPSDILSPTQVNSEPDLEEEVANEPDSRFLHQSNSRPTPSDTRHKRAKRKATPDSTPSAKRKRIVSEQDTDDEYTVDNDAAIAGVGMDGDEDHDVEHKRHTKKARAKSLGKPMKGKGAVSVPESAMKEGRNTSSAKTSAESSEPRPIIGSKRPRVKQDAGDVASSPDLSATRSPSPPRETSPPPTAKKRKLPPIKKNKPAGVPGPSTPSGTSAPNKPVTAAGLPKPGLPEGPKSAAVRKTPATAGNADFDLRNESVYRELFKSVSASFGRRSCSYSFTYLFVPRRVEALRGLG
jgi:hypothetical protein